MKTGVRTVRSLASLVGLALISAAPTAGDIGGCGQQASLLDDEKFFDKKASTDCASCQECDFHSARCKLACEGDTGEEFPEGCAPLVHDGEVCLRALADASCDDYRRFVADEGATTPTECVFCPLRAAAQASP